MRYMGRETIGKIWLGHYLYLKCSVCLIDPEVVWQHANFCLILVVKIQESILGISRLYISE